MPIPTSRSSRTTSVLPYNAASWSAVPVLVWRLISIPAFKSCLWWAGVVRWLAGEEADCQGVGGLWH